jgi:hypothetical protein
VDYYVLQADFRRESFEPNGVFSFDSTGKPIFSNQSEARQVYNWSAVEEAGTFPLRLCVNFVSDASATNAIVGINLPDQAATPGQYTSRFAHYPEWDYPLGQLTHNQKAGEFDFTKIPTWGKYWADLTKQKAISVFGSTRPNPGTATTQATRLLYLPVHHGYTIQRAVGSGSPLDWQPWDTNSGEPLTHTPNSDAIGQIYGCQGQDVARSQQPYKCVTVLGIHFEPTTATLEGYDYGTYGHLKITGSVGFEQRGCDGTPCGDPTGDDDPTMADCNCPKGTVDLLDPATAGPGRPGGRLFGDTSLGWISDPVSGNIYTDETSVILENMMSGNRALLEIAGNICSVTCELRNIRTLLSARLTVSDIEDELERIAVALEGLDLDVDTSTLVAKLEEIRELHKLAFTLDFLGTDLG